MISKEVLDISYASYLAEQIVQDANLNSYLQETILISENKNNYKNMIAVNEGFVDSIKNALSKVIQLFNKLWGRFLEVMTNLVNNTEGYLTKYKDIILRQPPVPEQQWKMYKWNEKELINTSIPDFNFMTMAPSLVSKEAFVKKYFPTIMNKNGGNVQELALRHFRGDMDEPDTIDESSLNIADLYNFCLKYKTMKTYMQKDVNNVSKAANECEKKLNDVINNAKKAEAQNNSAPPTQPAGGQPKNNPPTQPNQPATHESFYSFVHGTYLTEAEAVASSSNDIKNKPKANPSIDKPENTVKNNTIGGSNNNNRNTDVPNMDKDNAEEAIKGVKVYIDVCTKVATAKMSSLQSMFKDYMDIIKSKVRYYAGKKTSDTDGNNGGTSGGEKDIPGEKSKDANLTVDTDGSGDNNGKPKNK